jgi:hypothetical protein
MSESVQVFGCRPDDGGAAYSGGRRTKTSKGGNRDEGRVRWMAWAMMAKGERYKQPAALAA